MTGNGGGDHFVFNEVPWQPATITDFQVGTDQFDVTALLQQAGYTGSDPVGDGYIKFFTDSNGGSLLYFDPTPSTNPWGDNLGDVEHVAPSQLSDASLVGFGGTASPPPASPPPVSPPPASGGQTLQAQDGGSHLVGGSGADTLIGAHGPDVMTGAGGGDHFVFNEVPWQPSTITDFQVGVDQFDVSALLQQAGYTGDDPVGDGYIKFFTDSNGGTLLYFDATPSSNPWGSNLGDIQNVAPSNLSVADIIWH
jgi:Ca2+-binding RTX toxin-like protein